MSWIGWVIIGMFVLIAALMAYMIWAIYDEGRRRGKK